MAKKKSSQKIIPISYVGDNAFLYLFNSNPMPMWIIDLGTLEFLEVNNAAVAKYGYSRRKFLTMTIKDIHIARNYPYLTKRYSNSNLKFRYAGLFNHKLKNGSLIRVKTHVSNLYFTSRKCFLVMAEEISDKTNRGPALPGNAELLQTVLNNSPITLVATDTKGIISLIEGKMLEHLSLKPGQYVGLSALELFANLTITLQNEDKINAKELFRRVMAGEQITAFTELSGTHFENQFVPFRNAKGKVIGLIVVATIITERMQAEKALRESEERFRNLVELSPDMITVHREGRVVYINPAAAKLLRGIDTQKLIGKPMVDIIHPDYRKTLEDILQQVYQSNEHRKLVETKIILPDGEVVDIEVSSAPISYLGKPARQVIVREITERKQAENKLRESEKRFRALVEKSFEGISLLNSEGKFLYQTNSGKQLYGYSAEELVGTSAFDLVHPDFVDKAKKTFYNILNSPGSSIGFELKVKHKDKSWRWVEAVVTNLLNEPSVKAVVANYRDITDPKKVVEQLQGISTAIEQSADLIMITDQNGIIEYVNTAFLMVTGYSKDEVIGKTPNIFKSSMHSETFYKDFWERILAGNIERTKFIDRKKNGEFYIIEQTVTPVKNESGEITHFISTGRDVTEKERIEDELYKNSRILQSYIQYSIAPLVLLDKHFNFLQVNEAYAKACQRDVSEFIGHNHFEFYPSDAKADFEKVVNSKEAVRFVERPFVFSDHPEWGVTYWDWSLTPILDKMGEVEFLVFALRDVTQSKKGTDEIKKSHEQLRALYSHLQKAREEERTRIAREIHDSIGQSLTGLKMDLAIIENEIVEKETSVNSPGVNAKIKSMYSLLDDMVQSVRDLSAQLRPLILDSLGLATAIQWQTEEFQKKTGIKSSCAVPSSEIVLERDKSTALFRIFQESLTNIIRHANASEVKVKLEILKNDLMLEVADNGIGIPQNVFNKIDSLGLLGMKERAAAFGGSVEIVGMTARGTKISVNIPYSK